MKYGFFLDSQDLDSTRNHTRIPSSNKSLNGMYDLRRTLKSDGASVSLFAPRRASHIGTRLLLMALFVAITALRIDVRAVHAEDQVNAQDQQKKGTDSAATPRIPKTQWAFANRAALRYNPLGLQNELFVGYRSKLYDRPQDDLLFGKAYWWAGLVSRVSPQFAQTGLFVRALPIAILELQGIFSHVAGLSSAAKIPGYYTQGTRDAVAAIATDRSPSGELIRGGWQASLQARLQIKIGKIAIRSTNLFRHFSLNTEGDQGRLLNDDLFYDQTLDVLTPLEGWVYSNDIDALYVDKSLPWVVGARYTITKPLTDPTSSEVNASAMYDIQRAGLLFAWKFKAPPTTTGLEARRRHALIVLSQWHLDHRYRSGQSMNRLIPYFAVVYSLSGRWGQDD